MVNYYKKQVEIAREFGVSEGTVTNWIKGVEEGKNKLQLIDVGEKQKIIKNEHNRVEMLNLTDSGKKFRPDEEAIQADVNDELYSFLSENQVLSLINSLRSRNEIPIKFSFMGHGSILWDNFYKASLDNHNYTTTSGGNYLLKFSIEYLKNVLSSYDKVNIIDIGSGTGDPIVETVTKINSIQKLKNYVAIDISKELINITENKIKSLDFGINVCHHVIDAELNSLQEILYKYKEHGDNGKVCNLIFLIGGFNVSMIENEVRVLQNIRDGMDSDDFLVVTNAYDTVLNRTSFPAWETYEGDIWAKYLPSLIGITPDMYEKDLRFNENDLTREFNLILNTNIKIKFEKYNSVIDLKKGSKINLWRHRRDSFAIVSDKIQKAKLNLQFVAKHPSDPEILYISKIS